MRTGKEYESSSGSCLVNSDAYFNWRQNRVPRGKALKYYGQVFGDNKRKFKDLYGDQSFCWTGYVRHWVWVRQLQCNLNARLLVMCSSEGTTYEISFPDGYPWTTMEFEVASKEALEILNKVFDL